MKAVPVEKDSSGASLPPGGFPEELGGKSPPAGSYQQISCLDGVIRCGHFRPPPLSFVHSGGSRVT